MGKGQKKLNYNKAEDWMRCRRKGFLRVNDSLQLNLDESRSAFLIFPVIDSGEYGFLWDRLVLKGFFPKDSAVSVYARAWNGGIPEGISFETDMSASDEAIRKKLYNLTGLPVSKSYDCLLGLEGQKLFLALEISTGGREAPVLSEVILTVESDHMIDYLPSIYRQDDFTRRFLSVFNSMFLDMESSISEIPELFDLANDREDIIKMLAAWLSVHGSEYGIDKLKEWIQTAFIDHEEQFTKKGLERSIERMTGRVPLIIEHFEVNPHSAECADSQMYERLYGSDPFTFFVLLPEGTFKNTEAQESFLRHIKGFIPAGRKMELIILKQGIQLDWHSYLGVNSLVGDYTSVKIDDNTALHFDTVIGKDNSDG